MLEDGLEDVENMYTAQLNDNYYNPRKKTCTQSYIHSVNYTTRNSTYNGTTRDNTHNGTKEDGIHKNTAGEQGQDGRDNVENNDFHFTDQEKEDRDDKTMDHTTRKPIVVSFWPR